MVTVEPTDEVEISDNEQLRSARSFLEYVGRSAREGLRFVIARDVGTLYGHAKRSSDEESERELVQYALDFANEDTDRSLIKEMISTGRARLQRKNENLTPEQQIDLDQQMMEVSVTRRREFLSLVLADPERAAHQNLDRLEKQLQRFWSLPKLTRVPGSGIRRVSLDIMLDLQSFEAHVDSLLLDGSQPYGRDLCQCRLASCGRFFLVKKPPTGRPQRFYCSSDHMLEAHALQSGKRAQLSRARKTGKRASRKHK
jgi:hypothetical protein